MVQGVFTADPRKHADAQLLPSVGYRQLEALTGSENSAPGQYRLMDGVALTILERCVPLCPSPSPLAS